MKLINLSKKKNHTIYYHTSKFVNYLRQTFTCLHHYFKVFVQKLCSIYISYKGFHLVMSNGLIDTSCAFLVNNETIFVCLLITSHEK